MTTFGLPTFIGRWCFQDQDVPIPGVPGRTIADTDARSYECRYQLCTTPYSTARYGTLSFLLRGVSGQERSRPRPAQSSAELAPPAGVVDLLLCFVIGSVVY